MGQLASGQAAAAGVNHQVMADFVQGYLLGRPTPLPAG